MQQIYLISFYVICSVGLVQTDCYSIDAKNYLDGFKQFASEGSVEDAIDLNKTIYDAYVLNEIEMEEIFSLQMKISDYLFEERLFQYGLEYFKGIKIIGNLDGEFDGHKHYHLGRFYNALNSKTKSLLELYKAKEQLSDTKYIMQINLELGDLYRKCDEDKFSAEFLNRALSFVELHEYDPKTLFRLHSILVSSFLSISDIGKAEYHLVKLKYYSKILKEKKYVIKTKLVEAGIYFNTGRFPAAFRIIESLNISEITTPGFAQIINFYLGLGHMSENNNMETIKYLKKTVQQTEDVKPQELAMYHRWLGISYRRDCQYEKAKHHLQEAIYIYLSYEDMFYYNLRFVYEQLAYAHQLAGDNINALKYYLIAKKVAKHDSEEEIFINVSLITHYTEQLKVEYNSDGLNKLFTLMNETEQLVQEWNFNRRHVKEDVYGDYPIRFFYKHSLDALYFLYQYTKDDLILDRIIKHASALQSYLYFNNKVKFDPFKGSKIAKKLRQHENVLKSGIVDLKRQYAEDKRESGILNPKEKLYYLDSIEVLKKKYNEFMISNASFESLHYYNWQKPNFGLKDVQGVLTDEEAIISYYNTNEVFYTTLITKDDVAIFSKELNSDNLMLIDNYQKEVSKPVLDSKISFEDSKLKYSSIAFELYKFLLKDQLDKLSSKHKHLIIIPDNGMNSIPFKALLTEEPDNNSSLKNYPFLALSHSVAYEYSLQSFLYHKSKKRKTHKHQYVGMAPLYDVPSSAILKTYADNSKSSSYADFILRGSLVDLPSARQSVSSIAEQFSGGLAIVGKDATKTVLGKYTSDTDILHFAMHAVMDNENPELSQLLFSGLDEDKNLYAYELYNQDIDIELAMLSACDTGTGELDSGNSLQNMSQAFSLAGCSSLTMSFYKIPDVQTGMIDKYFIEHIQKGERIDEALRLSNIMYLEKSSDYFAHPFYWSGIVMSGKTDPLYSTMHSHFKIF